MSSRKDINALTDDELAAYIHAIGVLRQRSIVDPDDPTGYDYQAALHNDMELGPCEHANDQFMAWHRCHLYHFERLLREADPPRTASVRIPYWDWSRRDPAGRYPRAFSLPGLSAARNTGGADLPPNTLDIVKTERRWNPFGGWPKLAPQGNYGAFEIGPHNDMHGFYIGGVMGNPETAAEDPIYWSFHCFIDLCWAEWQNRNPAESVTSPKEVLRGFRDQVLNTVEAFTSIDALGYQYLYNAALAADFSVPSPAPRTLAMSPRPLSALFEGLIADEFASKKRAGFALPENLPDSDAIEVVLTDLSVPLSGSYRLDAFVHARHDEQAVRIDNHVGYVTMWKAHAGVHGHAGHGHGGTHHPTSGTVRFNIADAVARLHAEGHQEIAMTLRFIPAPSPSGQPVDPVSVAREITLGKTRVEVAL